MTPKKLTEVSQQLHGATQRSCRPLTPYQLLCARIILAQRLGGAVVVRQDGPVSETRDCKQAKIRWQAGKKAGVAWVYVRHHEGRNDNCPGGVSVGEIMMEV